MHASVGGNLDILALYVMLQFEPERMSVQIVSHILIKVSPALSLSIMLISHLLG